MKTTYTLICDNCGIVYYSEDAFPKPQYCDRCLTVYEAGIDKGRREVVEWVKSEYTEGLSGDFNSHLLIMEKRLQAKFKEWGIE